MANEKEFLKKMMDDKAFDAQVRDAVKAKKDAGAKDYNEAIVSVAKELGYEVTAEELRAVRDEMSEDISEAELGMVAGGKTRSGCPCVEIC